VIISLASGNGESFASAAYNIFQIAFVICQKKVQVGIRPPMKRENVDCNMKIISQLKKKNKALASHPQIIHLEHI
jgi:hypothetical protein